MTCTVLLKPICDWNWLQIEGSEKKVVFHTELSTINISTDGLENIYDNP